jgi:hypothetical protein
MYSTALMSPYMNSVTMSCVRSNFCATGVTFDVRQIKLLETDGTLHSFWHDVVRQIKLRPIVVSSAKSFGIMSCIRSNFRLCATLYVIYCHIYAQLLIFALSLLTACLLSAFYI